MKISFGKNELRNSCLNSFSIRYLIIRILLFILYGHDTSYILNTIETASFQPVLEFLETNGYQKYRHNGHYTDFGQHQ